MNVCKLKRVIERERERERKRERERVNVSKLKLVIERESECKPQESGRRHLRASSSSHSLPSKRAFLRLDDVKRDGWMTQFGLSNECVCSTLSFPSFSLSLERERERERERNRTRYF